MKRRTSSPVHFAPYCEDGSYRIACTSAWVAAHPSLHAYPVDDHQVSADHNGKLFSCVRDAVTCRACIARVDGTPDFTQHLRDDEFRTVADVARWLIAHPSNDAAEVSIELWGRQDRERRQACRRGALAAWREFRRMVHVRADASNGAKMWARGSIWMPGTDDIHRVERDRPDMVAHRNEALGHLADALAFREMARTEADPDAVDMMKVAFKMLWREP